ncbi:GerAB/ArcD/ProY family transporter [Fictibacillus gelatini]|uniref:GerAB/ArcD/ProY family transporter n=1 Tax=Fictibacillus gelatini TaxID=225985 RepID=UPI0003F5F404|nr:endospore germination permease [Fictibacillus gelatini]
MLKDEKLSVRQFRLLVILFSIGSSILILPSGMAAGAKQDAWIAQLLVIAISLLFIWLYNVIHKWFPKMTLVEICHALFGKWIGTLLSLFFLSLPFLYATILMLYSGAFLTAQIFSNTPMVAINVLMLLILVMGTRLGIETLARSAEILIIFFVFLLIILIVFTLPEIKLENIQPVFEAKPKTLLRTAVFPVITAAINSVVFLMILPHVNDSKKARHSFLIGHVIGGVILFIITALCILVLGADQTARKMYPPYTLAKQINVGQVITRIEVIIAVLWTISIYFKMAIYFYAALVGLAQLLNLQDYRPLVLPSGLIGIVLAPIIFTNIVWQNTWDTSSSIGYSIAVGVFLPILVLLAGAIKKWKQKNRKPG